MPEPMTHPETRIEPHRDHCLCCRAWWEIFYEERVQRRLAEDRLQAWVEQAADDPFRGR